MGVDNTGRNIKSLRLAFGETQMDLAYTLGLNSPSAISNYEKGIRPPERDLLQKIATHYLITVDELVHSDFSKISAISFPFDDTTKKKKMFNAMFPIICTDVALVDSLFKKGYDAHIRIFKAIEEEKDCDDKDCDICMDAYSESYESNGTLEAAANILGCVLLLGMVMENARMFQGANKVIKKQIGESEFIKNYLLRSPDEEYFDEDAVEQKNDLQEFLKDGGEEEIIIMLRGLKASPQWSDLADYYTAFRYIHCIVNNDLSADMNRTVGGEMMWAIAKLGNRYAKEFLRAGIETGKK